MVTRPLVVLLACSSYLLVILILLPKTKALRLTPNVDEYMIENQRTRTRKRQNYVIQQALDDEMTANLDNLVVDDFNEEINPEELSAQIVDYANMIRNDIIYLDNSVETTTRKKGSIKKKNDAIPDPVCSCQSNSTEKHLGRNYIPEKIIHLECLEKTCPPPYRCIPTYHNITVARKINFMQDSLDDGINRWVPHEINITKLCVCARDGIIRY